MATLRSKRTRGKGYRRSAEVRDEIYPRAGARARTVFPHIGPTGSEATESDQVYYFFDGATMYATIPDWKPYGLPYEMSVRAIPAALSGFATGIVDGVDPALNIGVALNTNQFTFSFVDKAGTQRTPQVAGAAVPETAYTLRQFQGDNNLVYGEANGKLSSENPNYPGPTLGNPLTTIAALGSQASGFFNGAVWGLELTDLSPIQDRFINQGVGGGRWVVLSNPITLAATDDWRIEADMVYDAAASRAVCGSTEGIDNSRFNYNSGTFAFILRAGGTQITTPSNLLNWADGQHVNMAVEKIGGTVTFYADGVAVHSTAYTLGDFLLERLCRGGIAAPVVTAGRGFANIRVTDYTNDREWFWALDLPQPGDATVGHQKNLLFSAAVGASYGYDSADLDTGTLGELVSDNYGLFGNKIARLTVDSQDEVTLLLAKEPFETPILLFGRRREAFDGGEYTPELWVEANIATLGANPWVINGDGTYTHPVGTFGRLYINGLNDLGLYAFTVTTTDTVLLYTRNAANSGNRTVTLEAGTHSLVIEVKNLESGNPWWFGSDGSATTNPTLSNVSVKRIITPFTAAIGGAFNTLKADAEAVDFNDSYTRLEWEVAGLDINLRDAPNTGKTQGNWTGQEGFDRAYLVADRTNRRLITIPDIVIGETDAFAVSFQFKRQDTGSQAFQIVAGDSGGESRLVLFDSDHATLPDRVEWRWADAVEIEVVNGLANVAQGEVVNMTFTRAPSGACTLTINNQQLTFPSKPDTRFNLNTLYGLAGFTAGIPAGGAMANVEIRNLTRGLRWFFPIDEGTGTVVDNVDLVTGNPSFGGDAYDRSFLEFNAIRYISIPPVNILAGREYVFRCKVDLRNRDFITTTAVVTLFGRGDSNETYLSLSPGGAGSPYRVSLNAGSQFFFTDAYGDTLNVPEILDIEVDFRDVSGTGKPAVTINGRTEVFAGSGLLPLVPDTLIDVLGFRSGAPKAPDGVRLFDVAFIDRVAGTAVVYPLDEGAGTEVVAYDINGQPLPDTLGPNEFLAFTDYGIGVQQTTGVPNTVNMPVPGDPGPYVARSSMLTAGKTYLIQWQVVFDEVGTYGIVAGGTAGPQRTGAGIYTETLTAQGAPLDLVSYGAQAEGAFKILSVREEASFGGTITPDAAWTYEPPYDPNGVVTPDAEWLVADVYTNDGVWTPDSDWQYIPANSRHYPMVNGLADGGNIPDILGDGSTDGTIVNYDPDNWRRPNED